MKSIKKIKESSKAVAGTALLVGATLAGGAAFATASSHGGSSGSGSMSSDLGDYPHPYVGEDGTLDSTIVMGEDAKATDVVAAANIAGQLGQDAHTTETQTVSVEGSFGWSATDGASLDTRNDQLFFGDTIDTVRSTLTDKDMDVLETVEVLTGDAEQEVEQYLYVGNQGVGFGTPGDTDGEEDPFLYVDNPSSINANNEDSYLYRLQANFEDGVEFQDTSQDDDRNDDVYGQEIAMFGMDFTVADASFSGSNTGQLVLYGSSEQTSVDSGQSETVTVGGEEVTVEVVGVTGSNTAAVRINGDLEQYSENDEETIAGEDLRVDRIIQTNADNSQGVVQFAIGSEKVILEDGEPIVTGDDEEEVEGTEVLLSGNKVDSAATGDVDTQAVELSTVEVAVGADDSDNSYVRAGESFEDPVFDDVQFHFGGLNPDSAEGGDTVGEVDFTTDGDDIAQVSFSDGDNSATIPFAYDGTLGNSIADANLGDDDGDFVVKEGAAAQEDDYVVTDAGDFSHVWQVTSIDRDSTGGNIASDDEATIELEDQVTGATVEVDLDATDDGGGDQSGDEYYAGTEVIDGQSYNFVLEGDNDVNGGNNDQVLVDDSNTDFVVTWGGASTAPATGIGNGPAGGADGATDAGTTSLYTAQDTGFNGAVAFYEPVSVTGNVELPSTDSTSEATATANAGTAEVFMGGEVAYSHGFVPAEGTTLGAFDTDSSSDLEISDTGSSVDSTYDLTVLYADGTTQRETSVQDDANTPTTVDLEDGKTVISIAVDAGDGEDGDTVQVEESGSGSLTAYDTVGDIRADNMVRIVGNGDQLTTPAAAVMEPEDDGDREDTYFLAPGTDTTDNEVDVGGSSAGIGYTGTTGASEASSVGYNTQTLESDDDMEVSYSTFGTYTMQDTEDQGGFTLHVPSGQATAGAAFTGSEGDISASAGGSGSVETMMPTGFPSQSVALDSDSFVDSAQEDSNLILVGGPAANSLVSELASMNKTWETSQYEDGQGLLQMVPDAFNEGHDALVVAGYSGEDTRAAGDYLVDYEMHSDMLSGADQVEINTAEGEVVQ